MLLHMEKLIVKIVQLDQFQKQQELQVVQLVQLELTQQLEVQNVLIAQLVNIQKQVQEVVRHVHRHVQLIVLKQQGCVQDVLQDMVIQVAIVINVQLVLIQLEEQQLVLLVQQVHIHQVMEPVVVLHVLQVIIKDQQEKHHVQLVQVVNIQQEEQLLAQHVQRHVMVIVSKHLENVHLVLLDMDMMMVFVQNAQLDIIHH